MFVAKLRGASTRRLLVALAVAVVAVASLTAIALAATGATTPPPPKPLAAALHDAATAPAVPGVSARIKFTNKLVDSAVVEGADPLLSGATGRLWVGSGRQFRLELQADRGDVEVVSDGTTVGVYDPGMNIAYRAQLPSKSAPRTEAPPTLADIQSALAKLSQHASVSGATPTAVAAQPAYSVRVSPANGGLVGAAELAWDAVRGVPLRAAVYARGDGTPVLELEATDISYGSIPASTFAVPAPQGAKTFDLGRRSKQEPASALAFTPSAPATLAGMARSEIRRVGAGELITYGQGLGGLAVLELPTDSSAAPAHAQHRRHDQPGLSLPTADIGGTTAQVLPTALGTVVRFDRAGVTYTVAGSVPQAVAVAAARGL